MPGITYISTHNYMAPSCVSAMDGVMRTAKKPLLAIGLTTLVIIGVQPQTVNSKPKTLRSFVEPVEKNQRLNPDRVDLKTIARIREIGTYPDGWDDANGKAASRQAIDDAENFIRQLFPDVKEPIITLAADGEINFLWILPNFRLDLGVYGDGNYSYYGKMSSGEEFIADENSLDEKLPEKIMAFITDKTLH
ncbi:MAG: hypothetical protein M0Q44_21335 [Methylobacter sp.]|jgi:hypothetical protein|nr:hypothetical protein [Methylobacter sp.]